MHGEPGTGTQYHAFATPPEDDSHPNTYRCQGITWKAGHDYLDVVLADVCTLVEVVGKSSWCDTRDPSDCPPMLVFEYERYDGWSGNRIQIDAIDPAGEVEERFIERYTADPPLGAPNSPW